MTDKIKEEMVDWLKNATENMKNMNKNTSFIPGVILGVGGKPHHATGICKYDENFGDIKVRGYALTFHDLLKDDANKSWGDKCKFDDVSKCKLAIVFADIRAVDSVINKLEIIKEKMESEND